MSRVDRWSHIPGFYAISLPWKLDELGLTKNCLQHQNGPVEVLVISFISI